MATSKFSFTFDWPMNSCRRCGRSFSSKEESSSTGAAETRRSFRSALSLAADTLCFPRIGDIDAETGEVSHVTGDEDEIVMKSCCRDHAVHDGQGQTLLLRG